MTHRPITIGPDASLDKAAALMIGNRVSGLPVVNAWGVVVGMITAGDLIRRAELGTARPPPGWLSSFVSPGHAAQDYLYAHGRKVREVMTHEVITVSPETALAEVTEMMESQQLKRLPVLEKGKLVGIVSRADLLRVPTQLLPRAERGDRL
jgi:CBS domain-containing protein